MSFREILLSFISSPDENRSKLIYSLTKITAKNENAKVWVEKMNKSPDKILAAAGIRMIDSGTLIERKIKSKGKTKPFPTKKNSDETSLEFILKFPLTSIKGIGSSIEEKFIAAGIKNLGDLLSIIPKSYMDLSKITAVSDLKDQEDALIHITINSVSSFRRRCFLQGYDDSGNVKISWFNTWPGMLSVLKKGATIWFWGKPSVSGNIPGFSHPSFSINRPKGFLVKYPLIPGIGEKRFMNAMEGALLIIEKKIGENNSYNEDFIPENIRGKYNFPSWLESRKILHTPHLIIDPEQFSLLVNGRHPAFLRIAYEELFTMQLALGIRNRKRFADTACTVLDDNFDKIISVFPFELTGDQKRVISEMVNDMKSSIPMNRLLQGDVGSGKTAVAFAVAAHVLMVGRQVAFMAPTTILAKQQYQTLKVWGEKLGYKTAILTAALTKGERESLLAMLEAGYIQILVGTQALIQERVEFSDLGLVIIDEQHRFGVAQRAYLREKGESEIPHLLVMTATPIPRTLALTAYGDLDQSIMKEKPPGRMPPVTKICSTAKSKTATIKRCDKLLKKGEKIFVVSPLIEKGEDTGRVDIKQTVEYLNRNMENANIGILHSKIPGDEKQLIIEKFRNGDLNLIVTTTVIEVGMDIPDAGVIIILESDRFGLAQLHQLRGRIGRSFGKKSFCYLFTSKKPTKDGKLRIKLLENNFDGFSLAEEDLNMRGPGEIIGTKQSGSLGLNISSKILGSDLLNFLMNAREDARNLLIEDEDLSQTDFLKRVVENINNLVLFGEEGG